LGGYKSTAGGFPPEERSPRPRPAHAGPTSAPATALPVQALHGAQLPPAALCPAWGQGAPQHHSFSLRDVPARLPLASRSANAPLTQHKGKSSRTPQHLPCLLMVDWNQAGQYPTSYKSTEFASIFVLSSNKLHRAYIH